MASYIQARFHIVVLRCYALYKPGLSANFSSFKLAASTYVLSILDVYHLSHIPQALHFHYYLSSSVGIWACFVGLTLATS